MNKQIEEMAKVMHDRCREIAEDSCGLARLEAQGKTMPDDFAEVLYNADYRKASEVAREIFAEIEQAIFAHGTKYAMKRLEELKKKYEVTEDENRISD